MIKRNGYFLAAILFSLSFMSACSKNLMPPEGLGGSSSAASVGSQMSESKGSGSSSGNAGRGFGIQEERGGSSGFLGEENVGESARSGEFGNTGPGGGSAGKFGSRTEPFLGDSSGSRSGVDEARRQSFKTSNSLKDIYFKFDMYDLDDESRSTLRQNASYLKSNSAAIIEIQGHCDERGTNNYNIALGERRAHSTKMYLVSQGISSKRIHTISYGEERPFCFDVNDACWFKNRRAHFRISE
jgi:peptidoglycan-associated lipoprotein